MKRTAWVVVLTVAFSMSSSLAAFAGYPPTKAPPGGAPPAAGGGVALTGANIALGMVILALLVVVGLTLTSLARRRRAGV
jgi:hypothetical protein